MAGHAERTYSMDELLALIRTQQADELKVHVGAPPVIVRKGELQPLEGPAITAEDADHLLRSLANTRQMREMWERGEMEFLYNSHNSSFFLVRARVENESVGFDVR